MNISRKIEQELASEFHAKFNVSKKNNSTNEEYIIKIGDSENRYFFLDVIIKEDIRLTILCEPEKYGANFVEELNTANKQKKKIFCDYWSYLGEKCITLKINDISVNQKTVMEDTSTWNRFSLKYTKAPFCDDSSNRDLMIFNAIKNVLSMVLSLTDYFIEGFEEGAARIVQQTKYERNPINRQLCLLIKGCKCSICGFDFEETYGDIGKGYIEVHHAIPVSNMEEGHIVDITKELYPVCSNCHSIIHSKKVPYTIEEVKQRLNK
jgi:5-methylcytosine-specific restriction protein A